MVLMGPLAAQFPDVCFGGGPRADRGAPLAAQMEHVFPVLELQFAQVRFLILAHCLLQITWLRLQSRVFPGRACVRVRERFRLSGWSSSVMCLCAMQASGSLLTGGGVRGGGHDHWVAVKRGAR